MLEDRDYLLSPYTSPKVGGLQTIQSFCPLYPTELDDKAARDYIKEHYPNEISFLQRLLNFLEGDRHIYDHAGIDPRQNDWKDTSHKDFRWIRGRFYNHQEPLPTDGKIVIFGHRVIDRLYRDITNF